MKSIFDLSNILYISLWLKILQVWLCPPIAFAWSCNKMMLEQHYLLHFFFLKITDIIKNRK